MLKLALKMIQRSLKLKFTGKCTLKNKNENNIFKSLSSIKNYDAVRQMALNVECMIYTSKICSMYHQSFTFAVLVIRLKKF